MAQKETGGLLVVLDGTTGEVGSQATRAGFSTTPDGGKFMSFSTNPDTSSLPSERMRIDKAGNLGIGTTTPGEALDVAGNIQASGIIASGNSITIDGAFDDENMVTSGSIDTNSQSK